MGVKQIRRAHHYLWPQGIVLAVIVLLLSTVVWTGLGRHTIEAYPQPPVVDVAVTNSNAHGAVITLAKYTPLQQYTLDCATEKCVALTFDDGPDGANTSDILRVLHEQNAQATFFVIGNKIAAHPESLRQMLADGHDIGNHSWDHKDFLKLSAGDIQKELKQTNDAVAGVVGITPLFMRPPYGDTTADVRKYINIPVVTWNVDPKDWSTDNPDQIVHNAVDHTNPGAIVVLHSTHPATAKALPGIIAGLRGKGYVLVPVSKLIQFAPSDSGKIFITRP